MSRLLAAVLILCTQVLAVFGTGNLVLCIHDDGQSALELVGSECCRAARQTEQQLPRGSDVARGVVRASDADRCTDVPYKQDSPTVSHGTRVHSQAAHDAPVAPVAVAIQADPVAPLARQDDRARRCATPRGPVPRRALPFVLRC